MGSRDLTAHWNGALYGDEKEMTFINLDGGSAIISFEGTSPGATFTVKAVENGVYTLEAPGEGKWIVGGFALKILKESGIDVLALVTCDSIVSVFTDGAAKGMHYAGLKAQGVGERRMTYEYLVTNAGECTFACLADGVYVPVEGVYTVSEKKEEGA